MQQDETVYKVTVNILIVYLTICWFYSCVGIEPTGNRVLRPAVFTVDTFSAGQGQVTVYLDHPDGTREEVRSKSSPSSFSSTTSLE